MIVRVKPHRTFGWAMLGLLGATILADFMVGGLLATTATWMSATPLATWATERFGVPFTLGELDAFEARDFLWAGFYGAFGAGLIVHGLRDLLVPRKVLVADDQGVRVHLGGWLGRATLIPWRVIDDIRAGRFSNLDHVSEALMVTVTDRSGLPDDPWGARWVDENTLGLVAKHWTRKPADVADGLTEILVRSQVVA